MKTVNLLCKGHSLNEFNKMSDSDFVVLSNDFAKELAYGVKGLWSYLETKDLHLVFNMVDRGDIGYQHIDFWNKFNVVKLIRPYLNGIRIPGSSTQVIPHYLKENFLEKNHMKFMRTDLKYPYDYPGTGIASFAYSILDCSADVINIVGMDFYDNLNYNIPNYLVQSSDKRNFKMDGQFDSKIMQEVFYDLIKKNPNVQVNLTTTCQNFIDGMEELENLKIKKVKYKNDKRLAVVIGGWHYPYEYYKQIKAQKIPVGWSCDYFIVSHRDPELPIVFDEKQPLLESRGDGLLQSFDKELYSRIVTKNELRDMGFIYNEEKSSIGDLYQLNQWVKRHYEGQYDKVLFTHDDNYLLSDELFLDILDKKADLFSNLKMNEINQVNKDFEWKHLSSGVLENTTTPRTSFTFLDKELLDKLAPELEEITTKGVELDRSGEVGTIYNLNDKQVDKSPLSSWNCPSRNFSNWMINNGYSDKSVRLSPVYRANKYIIEGERGFIWTQIDEGRIIHNLSQYYDLS
jgi:hypothetical protein